MSSRSRCISTVLLCATSSLAGTPAAWQAGPELPTNGVAKTHSVGLELNGTLFVLGGPPWVNPDDMEDGTVFSMPVGGSVWTEEAGFDGYGGVRGQGGGVDNLGRIIIFGGDDPLNPGVDKPPFEWNQEEGPWHEHAERNPLAPFTHFAFCTDDQSRIYSLGGGPGASASVINQNSTFCERFIGSTDSWETLAPMPIALAGAAASHDGLGHILVFGGIVADGSSRSAAVLQYDIATDSWSSSSADMPVALSDHEATLGADGRIYILGGTSGAMNQPAIESQTHVYDPATDEWFVGPEMSEPRRHFSSILGSDDRIYVIGGENFVGGSSGSESFYTTPCPVFAAQPPALSEFWLHGDFRVTAHVLGGGTITYQWMKEGIDVVDGPSSGGGVISGSTTNELSISPVSAEDSGQYTLRATNSCGSITSTTAFVLVRIPPDIPAHWDWTSLHPSYAEHSYAQGVDNGIQVGRAVFDTPDYNNIDHPMKWAGTAASGINLTPGGSQGGSITDFAGDKLVGWWWAPIQCYVGGQWQTCYYRRGARWDLNGNFYETSYSGFEYTSMNATDGVSIVGAGSTDDAVGNVYSKAVIWQAPTYQHALSIHPAGIPDSYCNAVDGEHQFGYIGLPFASIHAAKWTGSGASFVDMHPDGYINSRIVDASDNQQVGVVNQWNDPHAVIWNGTPNSILDLNPDGATSSSVTACDSGLQIGYVVYPDGLPARPGIWAGGKDTFVDLSGVVPPEYSGFNLSALDVAADGTISIVGSSYNTNATRSEAILITSTTQAPCLADFNNDGVLDFFDVSGFLAAFAASDPAADLNDDGAFDFFDVSEFLQLFGTGCP